MDREPNPEVEAAEAVAAEYRRRDFAGAEARPATLNAPYAKDDPLARLRTTIAVATVTEKFQTTIDQDLAAQVKLLLDEHDYRATFRPPPEHKQTVATLGHDLTRALTLLRIVVWGDHGQVVDFQAEARQLLAEYADGA